MMSKKWIDGVGFYSLWRRANAWNGSLRNALQWTIYTISSFDKALLFFGEQGSNENIGERFPWLCIGSSSLLLGSGSVDRN